ncbi:MAG TPA: hypothetical protein VMY42_09475 [Thermoguttaceae bacterium]|nr:hypothetical protein [Thermoguttaceae bacterium]
MSSLCRVSMASVVAGGLIWTLVALGSTRADLPGEQDGRPAVKSPSEDATLLAARYHLRNRTKRFFDRVGGDVSVSEDPQLAARYHLRGRTERFFGRVG